MGVVVSFFVRVSVFLFLIFLLCVNIFSFVVCFLKAERKEKRKNERKSMELSGWDLGGEVGEHNYDENILLKKM